MQATQVQTDPTNVMGKRIGAWFIDAIILFALGILLWTTTVDTATFSGVNLCDDPTTDAQICTVDDTLVIYDGDDSVAFEFGDTTVSFLVQLLYGLGVFVVWQGLAGLTPGKAALGLRTVGEDGQVPGIGKAFLRTLLWIVDGIPYCCYIPVVGGIAAFTSKGHRRVGDMAAKTFVIDRAAFGQPVHVPGLTAPPAAATAPPPTGPPVAGAPTAAPPQAMPGPGAGAGAGEPRWDPQRNAYIVWDQAQQRWLQFDDATQQWRPIE